MIEYVKGDLLNSKAEALVNTVNTVGVMGKGIALQFKNRYPNNYIIYKEACKNDTLTIGKVLVVKEGDLISGKTIINFPTKKHWRSPSKYEYISEGLIALKSAIHDHNVKSLAMPPLGCGNGGLEWEKVQKLIEESLKHVDCHILVFTPNEHIKNILQESETKKEVNLTPARAMMLYLMFQYEAMGEQSSLFVANKLAYFLQRSGENLKLKFEPHYYGPYAVQLNHVLLYLNGVYLKGLEQNVARPFEPLQLEYSKYEEIKDYINTKLDFEQRQRLKAVMKLLKGFESTFSLELLATVDYLNSQKENQSIDEISFSLWSARKKELFKKQYIQIAYDHLHKYSNDIFANCL